MAVKLKIKKLKDQSIPVAVKLKINELKDQSVGDDKGALRAAKQGAKAKVKSEFKAKVAEAKSDMSKKEAKSVIGEERKKYIAAKKEIRKYTDY
jgi:hypothetical protein